jgi:hypothetical protein
MESALPDNAPRRQPPMHQPEAGQRGQTKGAVRRKRESYSRLEPRPQVLVRYFVVEQNLACLDGRSELFGGAFGNC